MDTWPILEVLNPKTSPRENLKQHPIIYSRNYHHLVRHNRGEHKREDYVLSLYDISSAIRWTFKSNFDKVKQSEQVIATKKLSTIIMDAYMSLWTTLQRNLECHHG